MSNTEDHNSPEQMPITSTASSVPCDQSADSGASANLSHSGTVDQGLLVFAPMPDFVPPLEGEADMLLQLLGDVFTKLIRGD